MPSGKGLPTDLSDFLRARIREWLAADSTRTQADLARGAGIARATLSNLMHGSRGAGWHTASGLARTLGIDLPPVLQRSEEAEAQRRVALAERESPGHDLGPESEKPELANRPGWADASAEALRRYAAELAPFSILLAGRLRGLSSPDPITPEFVRTVARFRLTSATDEERDWAVEKIARQAMAAGQARHDAYEATAAEHQAKGRPAPLPPILDPPRAMKARTTARVPGKK